MGGFIATVLTVAYKEWQDPIKIGDAQRIGTVQDYGAGLLLFGDDSQPARARHTRIGHTERWLGSDSREYSLQIRQVGVRAHDPDWIEPTPEEFDAWLAYANAGGSSDLQEWLSEN